MAAVRSLGVHTPSGLPYLIAEGFLPEDPQEDSYTWETYNESHGQEEVLTTEQCVVWSRGGVVRKAFSFDAEKQKVQQAVLTWFPSEDDERSKHQNSGSSDASSAARKRQKLSDAPKESSAGASGLSRALVIFLKHQAHIYFLTGASHVLNLHFEVEKAFPAPRGLMIQRKLPTEPVPATPIVPGPPNNSFFSSFATRQSQNHSSFRPSGKSSEQPGQLDFDLLKRSKTPAADTLPRHFCLTNPLSEFGLIVHAPPETHQETTHSFPTPFKDLESLDKDEEILYVSSSTEVVDEENRHAPLTIVVTANQNRRVYSIWQALYADLKPLSSLFTGRKPSSVAKARRRSSFVTTGATTPAVRGLDKLRESLGPAKRNKKTAALNASQSTAHSEANAEDLMASQLDPDFDTRQPAKETRRVSGMLSRADLSTSFDRSAFQELASHRTNPRISIGPSGRRGVSLGGANDRTSFGTSSHRKLRSSTPGAFSRLSLDDGSDMSTLLNIDGDESFLNDDLDDLDDIFWGYAELDAFDFQQPFGGLRKEVFIFKFAEIPISESIPLRYSFGPVSQASLLSTIRVFTISSPRMASETHHQGQRFFIHIMNRNIKDHIQIEYRIQPRRNPAPASTQGTSIDRIVPIAICKKVVRLKGHLDVVKISDSKISRLLCLEDKPGDNRMRLYAPWSPETTFEVALDRLRLFNPFGMASGPTSSPSSAGKQRTVLSPRPVVQLLHPGSNGTVSLRDVDDELHRVQIQLGARNDFISKVFELCLFVLPAWTGDMMLSIWWIQYQSTHESDQKEWTALVEAIFIMALSLDEGEAKRRKSEAAVLAQRTSPAKPPQTSLGDAFARMVEIEKGWNGSQTWASSSWAWAIDNQSLVKPSSKSRILTNIHISIAREFVKSTRGQTLLRPLRSNPDIVQSTLSVLLTALHLLREERKLDSMSRGSRFDVDLAPILAQLGRWLGWSNWDWKQGHYFSSEAIGTADFGFEDVTIRAFTSSSHGLSTREPPSIYAWLEHALSPEYQISFPSLDAVLQQPFSQTLKEASAYFFPRTTAIKRYLVTLHALDLPPMQQVEAILEAGISVRILETFPEAIYGIIKDSIMRCQGNPSTTWTSMFLDLVDRDDLVLLAKGAPPGPQNMAINSVSRRKLLFLKLGQVLTRMRTSSYTSRRDVHSICHSAEGVDIPTHPESDRMLISRLIFNEDRRFLEALRIIEPLRTPIAECIPDPSWSESQLLEAQKEVVQCVMVRTFALAPGQAMAHFDSRRPFPTEKYTIHGYSTACVMKPMGNTVSADRTSFTEEKYGWAWFHAGVAAGLGISRHAKGIDTSWIIFNKPPDLNVRHAGLLLALGLNGHLKNVAKYLCFKYLTPKHTMTSIGLLLGLAASNLGSMDTLVTRLLSVHVTRMLPPGAAELNLSSLTQTAGLMGIGLLYYNTQHRRMSEIMLSEIETVEAGDSSGGPDTLRDESYRLAAGFALGFINLAQGNSLKGIQDMRIIERLLAIAVGSRPVDLVHILDQATAGATIAVALIFMKTGNKAVARKVDVPETLPQFDYIRPDILLLRTLAKHLILWNDIKADYHWIASNLPKEYAHDVYLRDIKSLRTQHMPYYNILTGLLWSISLKYAGSGNTKVRDFLVKYLDALIRLCKLPALRYDAKLTRNTVRNCQDLVALSCATVMAGTGDLDVMRRLRSLHGRTNTETPYGSHLAAHMALGALFLGGGSFTFGTSNLAIASLICAFYPLYPMDVTDNKAHLQPLRHLWVLAAEPRCIITRDVDTNRAIRVALTVRLRDGTSQTLTAPCLLPELDTILQVETSSKEYWPIILDFANNPSHLAGFTRNQTLHVRRRPASQAHNDIFSATLVSLNDAQTTALVGARKIFGSIFQLPILLDFSFEMSDMDFVLPVDEKSGTWLDSKGSVVDDKLTLVRAAVKSTDRDMLWNLRVLFKWAEWAAERGDGGVKWLGLEVITALKGIVEERARRVQEEE